MFFFRKLLFFIPVVLIASFDFSKVCSKFLFWFKFLIFFFGNCHIDNMILFSKILLFELLIYVSEICIFFQIFFRKFHFFTFFPNSFIYFTYLFFRFEKKDFFRLFAFSFFNPIHSWIFLISRTFELNLYIIVRKILIFSNIFIFFSKIFIFDFLKNIGALGPSSTFV